MNASVSCDDRGCSHPRRVLPLHGLVKREVCQERGRGSGGADQLQLSQGGDVAAAIVNALGEAPSLHKADPVPVPPRANCHVITAAAAVPASSLCELLRVECGQRHLALPSRIASDSSMQAVVHMVEALYVDDILKHVRGNVSRAGSIAKLT